MKSLFFLLSILLFSSFCNAQLFGGQLKTNKNWANSYPAGSVFCASGPTPVVEVINPTTGKIWMDRNLGASQVATSSTDATAYGDLYQWGRRSDGHQCRNSATTTTLSSVDQPAHDLFILIPNQMNSPSDWRNPQNNNLWQGVNGVNNPCPFGYRIPSEAELDEERLSWSTNDATGAFNSVLRLTVSGNRNELNGLFYTINTHGDIWSSTIDVTTYNTFVSKVLEFNNVQNIAFLARRDRAYGFSVRCIRN
jgi:uncharacterized protein (TIGR02145 family)